jgi:hypothetical protein
MQGTQGEVSLRKLVITGAVTTIRPPFRMLLLVELLITLVAASIPASATDAAAILGALVLLIVSAVLQIAILLAAAKPEPDRSADPWIVAAARRRCFWRFVLTRAVVTIMILLGVAVVLLAASGLSALWQTLLGMATALIWGYVVGSVIGVSEQAAVLERRWPFAAMGRSSELTRPARRTIGTLFAVAVVAPNFLEDRFLGVDLLKDLGPIQVLPALVGVVVSTAGLIALTRAYTGLGGSEVTRS